MPPVTFPRGREPATLLAGSRAVLTLLVTAAIIVMCPAQGRARQQAPVRLEPSAAGLTDFRQGSFAEAYQRWHSAAEAGDARSALYLGVMFDAGEGVRQDYGQARRWYERAASGGNVVAMFNLAVMEDTGLGSIAPDHSRAAYWYRRAAGAGSARAAFNLALMYQNGDGIAMNRAKAVAMFRLAQRRGLTAASDHLRALGVTGGPVEPSAADSVSDDFRAAEMELLRRTPQSTARAAELFRHAAEAHDAAAAYDLGYCYDNGIGVGVNKALALSWYRAAAADTNDQDLRSIADAAALSLIAALPEADKAGVIEPGRPPPP